MRLNQTGSISKLNMRIEGLLVSVGSAGGGGGGGGYMEFRSSVCFSFGHFDVFT